jgi:cytidylate kinase
MLVFERARAPIGRVTLDGPSRSGKTTLARTLAKAIGWSFLDSGGFARAFALQPLRGDALEQDVRDGEVIWRLDGTAIDLESIDSAVRARCADPVVDRAAWQALLELDSKRTIVVGRSLGRFVDADQRLYLDTPTEVRAARARVSVEEMEARDAAERERGRLLDPDLAAVILDGREPLETLVQAARLATLSPN